MKHTCRPIVVKLLLGILIILALSVYQYSLVILNRGDDAFDGSGDSGDSVIIGSSIIDGGGYYLKSYSDALVVLQRIEWSDTLKLDYNELSSLLQCAIDNMGKVHEAYARLKQAADNTPYNPVFVEKLISFDYNGFKVSRALDGNLFDVVKNYLSVGDVRGIFTHILTGTEQILNVLKEIKSSTDAGRFPDLSALWRLNRLFSETMITGQYAAEIFYAAGDK